MAGVASGSLQFDHHQEAVESALDAEDLTPLVRLVFDAAAASLNTYTTKQTLLTRAPVPSASLQKVEYAEDDVAAEGRRASDRLKATRKEAAKPILNALGKVVESRSAEISQICRNNAEEIVSSLQELAAMQAGTEQLRRRIQEGNESMQQSGGNFLRGLEQLQDLRRVQTSVAASCQAVGAAKQLLLLVSQAGKLVNNNELYKAFCLFERAQTAYLGRPPEATDDDLNNEFMDASGPVDPDSRLHAFVLARTQEMRQAIEHRAIADFNSWLVSVRAEARKIGMRAVRRAAWERQREENMAQQRRVLAAHLANITDPLAAGTTLVQPLRKRSPGSLPLKATIHPAAVAVLAQEQVRPLEDVLEGIDMSHLHRCIQMHKCLGRLPAFQAYYQRNRRGQLNNDLAVPANFLAAYEKYVAQLVGFFIIEDRVGRTAEALSEVDSGWETAVAYTKMAMEAAFETATSASAMLSVKDFILLVCSALGQCGYHVAPLQDILMNARTKYQELLSAALEPVVKQLISAQGSQPLSVTSSGQATELTNGLGLSLAREGTPVPPCPFRAPFSDMVPQLLQLARRFVEESAAYAWGLVSQGEVLAVVRPQRDAMLLALPLRSLQAAAQECPVGGKDALPHALQMVADLHALAGALPALDEFTFVTVRGVVPKDKAPKAQPGENGEASATDGPVPEANEGSPTSQSVGAGVAGKIGELQSAAEDAVEKVLADQVIEVMRRSPGLDWLPDQPVKHVAGHSAYINNLIAFLQETLQIVAVRVPQSSYHNISQGLMRMISDLLLGVKVGDGMPAYNLYALFRLNDDVSALADFASKWDVPGMENGLAEVVQFCTLMVTGRLEEILNASKRKQAYSAINLPRLVSLLRKYREIGDKANGTHGLMRHKQPESFLKKKVADRVTKQLRTLLDAQPA